MCWEPPGDEVRTGVGTYLNCLAGLGGMADLTFVVPGEADGLRRWRGCGIRFIKTPGFSGGRRYDEDMLYPSCRAFAERVLGGRVLASMRKFDLVLATSFAFGGLISKARAENLVYVSHRPEFMRAEMAEEFGVDFGSGSRLRLDAELEAGAVACAGEVVAVSRACGRELRRWYGRAIRVIPNGVDTGLFSRTGPGPERAVLTYVGRNHPEKGVPLLLRAAGRAACWGAEFELRLLTDSDGGLEMDVRRLGLGDRVRLVGWKRQRDLPGYYSGSSFTVVPSYWESFSYAAAESLSCGTPVVASTAGALPGMVDGCGMLFKAGDEEGLAEVLCDACDSPSRDRMGRRGRRRIEKRFSSKAFLGNYMKLIDETS